MLDRRKSFALVAAVGISGFGCEDYTASWKGTLPSQMPQISPYLDGLSVSESGRYFMWRGEGLTLMGDSVTHAWAEAGADFDHRAWIDALSERGINTAMLWAFMGSNAELRRNDRRIGYDAPTLWPWCGRVDTRDIDLTCFNESYFHKLRDLVAYAESRGIVVMLTVHDGWTKGRFDQHPFNSALGNGPLEGGIEYVELAYYGREMPVTFDPNWDSAERNQYFQERFSARLIETLRDFGNVIYEMFNEGEWYDRRLRRLHELHFLRFFRARTGALLASNTDHISGLVQRAHMDIVSLHSPRWSEATTAREIFRHYSTYARREPEVPIVFSETVPEWQGGIDAIDALMRLSWGALLGGGHVIIQNDSSFRFASRTGMASYSEEGSILLERLGHVARFAAEVNMESMRPEPSLCSTGVCMADRGVQYIVHSDGEDELWVNLEDVPARTIRAHWHNSENGRTGPNELVVPARRVYFRVPDKDAVLHLMVSN